VVGDVFSSCVQAVDLRLSDSDVTLVFVLQLSSNIPAYSRTLQRVCPNIGNEFKRLSVEADEIMFATWLPSILELDAQIAILFSFQCQSAGLDYCSTRNTG
jgi:hypothetical protein